MTNLLGRVELLLLASIGLRLSRGRSPASILCSDLSLDLLGLLQLADGAVVVRPLRAVVRGCRPAATRHRGRGLLRLLGTRRMLESSYIIEGDEWQILVSITKLSKSKPCI